MADVSKITIPSGTYNFKDSRIVLGDANEVAVFKRTPFPADNLTALSGHTIEWKLAQWGSDYYVLGLVDGVKRVAIPVLTCFASINKLYTHGS